MGPDGGLGVEENVEEQFNAGKDFADLVFNALAEYGRRSGIVADGVEAAAIGEVKGALVVVFLRNKRHAVEAVYRTGFSDRIERARAFIIKDDAVGRDASGDQRIAYRRGLVAAVRIARVSGVIAAAGYDIVNFACFEKLVGRRDSVVKVEIMSPGACNR